jgi:chaperonin GroES
MAVRGPILDSMRHQLRPMFDRIVIKELDPDRVRRSGLLVPAGSDEPPPQQGIVLSVGPGLDWWEHVGVRMPIKPGDHVVFPSSAGAWVEVDEERLLVCRVGELLGVLEEARQCPACADRRLGPAESCPVCGREGSVASP